jgi:Cu2+-exporting ATPase
VFSQVSCLFLSQSGQQIIAVREFVIAPRFHLVNSRLSDAVKAVRLGRKTLRNIHENLFWAFFYNALLIPLAAGAYYKLFGWALNPMLGAAAMSLSSFCVVTNALRLNLFDAGLSKGSAAEAGGTVSDNTKLNDNESEEKQMTKTMKIEGMMCPHCEAAVKGALEALDGVTSAEVSHEAGTAVVSMSAEVADAALREAVEAKDYKVLGIE